MADGRPAGPLAGYRVIDITSVVMGPLATQILGDLGADVITIEQPVGDANRHMGIGPHPDLSGPALNLMRNKRSIVLDLQATEGYEVLTRLVASADVFVTNLRPGSRERSRLRDDDLRRHRADLVYCAASGFPTDDPRADDAAYDDIIQSAAGMVDVHDRAGLSATLSPTILVDKVTGMAIANGVTTALLHRERTGEGTELTLAMSDIMTGFLLVEHGAAAIPEPPTGGPGYPRLLSAERRPLRTADGLVTILAYERSQFEGIMRIGGRDDLIDDPRFETRIGRLDHMDELYSVYRGIAATMDTETFVRRCREHGVPAHRVVGLDELVAGLPVTEHPIAGRYRVTPSLAPGAPAVAPHRPAPITGQHGREILLELGYDEDAVNLLESTGVLGRPR